MATGIQTGMRTGSAPMPTGARGGAPAGGGSPIQKFMQAIGAMSPKQKIIGGALIGLLLVAVVSFALYSKSSEYVPLYDTPLSQTDVSQITAKLTQMNIPYKTTEGAKDILVSPSTKSAVKIKLAEYGLPLRQLNRSSDSGIAPKTREQIAADKVTDLEAELTESVRQIQGVADAYVKIAVAKEDLFDQNKEKTKASVMLNLAPGIQLTVPQIKGIVHLVAFSVQGLEPGNVEVIDTQGIRLTTPEILGNEDSPDVIVGGQLVKKADYESGLQKKVQSMLDKVLGQNKAVVTVDATLDFSNRVTESIVVGGAGNTDGKVVAKKKSVTERYTSDPESSKNSGAAQMSFKGGASGDNANYSKEEVVEMVESNKVIKKVQTPAGTLQRLTASVMVDNLKPDQVANIEKIVKNSIGMDESRGDSIAVASMPFAVGQDPSVVAMRNAMAAGPRTHVNTGMNKAVTPAVAVAAMVILFMLAMIYMLRQKGVQTEKSRLILSGGSATTSSDISDLVSDKIGRSTLPADTKVNTSEQLEKLAKEKPTKVAELLKSTWLADKER